METQLLPRLRGSLRHTWLAFLALAAAALSLYLVLDGVPRAVLFDTLSLAAAVAVFVGIRARKPAVALPWILLGLGQLCWFAGDTTWDFLDLALGEQPFPSVADALYLSGYVLLVVGFLLLPGGWRSRPDWPSLLDAAILGTGAGLVLWVALVDPILSDGSLTPLERAISVGYPLGDIVVLACVFRLLVNPAFATRAFQLLALAVLCSLAGDVVFAVGEASDPAVAAANALFLVGYGLWGAAVLHPSMGRVVATAVDTRARLTRRRMAALTVAALVGPAILVVEGAMGLPIDTLAIAVGCALTTILVLGRLGILVARLGRSLSEQRRLERDLRHQAFHDPLTDLPNRALLLERLARALDRRDALVALVYLDLDDFKLVNDTLGHEAGDRVLREVAHRLLGAVRRADTVARMGGDEYAILLDDINAEGEALRVGERVLASLDTPLVTSGIDRAAGASVGIALARSGMVGADDMLRNADLAMYRAKTAGGARIEIYDPEMHQDLMRRVTLQADLSRAIDAGDLVVHYQPVVDLASQATVGLEALVRWRHPEVGLLPPGDFIGIAEESGLIAPLGRHVLAVACRAFQGWRAAGLVDAGARLSVNVSARQLRDVAFATDVARAAHAAGLDPAALVLEITESALVDDAIAEEGTAAALRAQGFGLALDDFGTGYASLANLTRLHVDEIKIDRSFVAGLAHDPQARGLCAAVVSLGRTLGMRVVAEGIEDEAQRAELMAVGCRTGQGFLLGRPMSEDAAAAWLAAAARIGVPAAGRVRSRGAAIAAAD